MIVEQEMSWGRMLVTKLGSGHHDSWPRILMATAFAIVVTIADLHFTLEKYTLTATPFTIIGVALSIFLGFRNNTAYSRWWEARTLWGALINTCRSLAREALTLLDPPKEAEQGGPDGDAALLEEQAAFGRDIVRRTIGYTHALRHLLRVSDPSSDLSKYVPEDELPGILAQKNVPLAVLQSIALRLQWARRQGWIHPLYVTVLEGTLTDLTNIQGGCERIRNTPLPFAYRVLSHRIVASFCFLLPLGILDAAKNFTPLVVFLVSHAFFGLDSLGEELEEPFGTEPHDLPLAAMSRIIEVNLLQMAGEANVPEMLKPHSQILL